MCLFDPHKASHPSGSLAPGESQAGPLPRGCAAAVWSRSRKHIKAADPEEPAGYERHTALIDTVIEKQPFVEALFLSACERQCWNIVVLLRGGKN